jgi:hypothetical protein
LCYVKWIHKYVKEPWYTAFICLSVFAGTYPSVYVVVWWWGHQSSLGNADIPLIAYIQKSKMFIVHAFVWHLHIIYVGMYVLSFCWSVCFWATWLYLCAQTDQRDNRSWKLIDQFNQMIFRFNQASADMMLLYVTGCDMTGHDGMWQDISVC